MSLLDKLKTDLSSFDYSKVGTKHGEYFGEDNATGFTPNRNFGDPTEYVVESSVGLDGWPGPVNFMKDNNATGFTIGRQEQDPTEFFTQSSIKLDGFPGPVDYFTNTNASGYTLFRKQGDITEYNVDSSIFRENWPGPVDYFDNNNATGFTLDRQERDPSEYIPNSTTKHEMSGVTFPGPVNFFNDDNAPGFTLNRQQQDPSQYVEESSNLDNGVGNILDSNLQSISQGNAGSVSVGQGQTILIGDVQAVSGVKNNIELPFGQYVGETIASQTFLTKMYDKFNGNKGLRDESGFSFQQPFVIREIGERDKGAGESNAAFDEGLFRGGIVTYTNRMITDVERIGKFLLSPQGLVWNVKQFVLQRLNPRKETKNFNPLSTPLSATGLFHEPRHNERTDLLPDNGSTNLFGTDLRLFANPLGNAPRYEKVVNEKAFKSNSRPIEDTRKTDKETAKAVKSGVDYLSSRENGGSKGTLELRKYIKNSDGAIGVSKLGVSIHDDGDLQVPYQGQFGQIKKVLNDKDFPKDLIKFRIRDAVNGKWIIFPAYIEDIGDNSSAEYSQERYIGRPDQVHIYQGYTRNISFNFKVAALKRNDVPIIWEKLNALKGLTTPSFKQFLTEDKEVRPVAPYVYLTIGDLFNNTPGYFSSVNVTINNTMSWEISDGVQYPHVADVSLEFVYLGKKIPQTLGKHYDIPWLKDSGVGSDKFGIFGSEDPKNSSVKYPDREGIDIDGERVSYGTWLGKGKTKAGPPPPPPRPTIPIPTSEDDFNPSDLPIDDLPF